MVKYQYLKMILVILFLNTNTFLNYDDALEEIIIKAIDHLKYV